MNQTIKTDLGNKEVFSRNLARCIKRADKTQREIAKAVRVSPSTVCDWLNGRGYPRMDKLQLLADYFGISKAELVEDNYVAKETVSEREQKLLDLFHKVPEDKQDGLLELIEVYSKNLR